MNEEEQQLYRELVWCYKQIGVPVIKETLEIFLECSNKPKMVELANEWVSSMRH